MKLQDHRKFTGEEVLREFTKPFRSPMSRVGILPFGLDVRTETVIDQRTDPRCDVKTK